MAQLLQVGLLERGILIIPYIAFVMLIRKYLNRYSLKYSAMVLWGILLLRLVIPYAVFLQVSRQETGFVRVILFPIIFIGRITVFLSEQISLFLPEINRVIITVFVVAYVLFQILKLNKVLKKAKEIKIDKKLRKYLMKVIPIKREVKIFINDDLKAPVTYGVLYPKIIIQDRIVKDKVMLKYVLVHEMTHVKKFDVLWNHLKNILVCVYWYNPFVWLMSMCIAEDLEVLCDKLVVERTGNKDQSKLEYVYVMFQVLTQAQQKEKISTVDAAMKLNPTVERMLILKNMQVKKACIVLMSVILIFSITAFTYVEEKDMPTTTVIKSTENREEFYFVEEINRDNRTKEIKKEAKENERFPAISSMDKNLSIPAFGSKTHKFTIDNFYGGIYNNFITRISNVSSTGKAGYELVIEEDGEIIYQRSFKEDVALSTKKVKNNSDYKVTVINKSNKSFNYDISIQSYR